MGVPTLTHRCPLLQRQAAAPFSSEPSRALLSPTTERYWQAKADLLISQSFTVPNGAELKPFAQKRRHITQILHPGSGCADDLRSYSPLP
jgi:hypothetical protein